MVELWQGPSEKPSSYARKEFYSFGKKLNDDAFGEVHEAVFNTNGQRVTIKAVMKNTLSSIDQVVPNVIDKIQQILHPNIVKLLDWFESEDKYYLVYQPCTGKSLLSHICDAGKCEEEELANIMRGSLEVIAHLHENNLVHYNIRPENLMFLDTTKDAHLMLTNVGVVQVMKSDEENFDTMKKLPEYVAPEALLRQSHGKPVDMWAVGIVVFASLCGYHPFWEASSFQMHMTAVQSNNVEFDERYWQGISDTAKDFIRHYLHTDPQKRMTARQALQHPWLNSKNADLSFSDAKKFYKALAA